MARSAAGGNGAKRHPLLPPHHGEGQTAKPSGWGTAPRFPTLAAHAACPAPPPTGGSELGGDAVGKDVRIQWAMSEDSLMRPGDGVLVTGASGFVGSAVLRALAGQGLRLRALVR